MATDSRARIDELFHEALGLRRSERRALIERIGRDDAHVRSELESLLSAHEAAAAFLEKPIVSATDIGLLGAAGGASVPLGETAAAGAMIGRYRVVEPIASGGMGAVYRAVRADAAFEQQVAVKLIRRGLLTPSMRRRFHRERQTLARLEHPNITRLIDGGTTTEDAPYLVMEYVDGLPIDQYCDAHRLGINDRLELFRAACDAVHFAHQNLIVHRDLKPRNILVTGTCQPKLLDFGIATLLDEDSLAPPRDAAMTIVRALTPRYASPEQVRGERVTTSADIYSLGIVLYELLTGHRPYALDGTSASAAERVVCEQVPATPSAVVSNDDGLLTHGDSEIESGSDSVADLRGLQPGQLRRTLCGDLDNIVLMAIAKEPSRRYGSVQQFSEDIRRYLNGLPVIARKDTLAYRVGKWTRRNKGVAIAGAVALAALVVGVVGATTGLIKARRAEQVARIDRNTALQAQSEAQAVTHFLQDVLSSANPYRRARDVTVEELLADASRRIPIELAGQPAVEAGVRLAIARTYAGMWSWSEAIPHLRLALPAFRAIRGNDHPDVADCLSLLGRALTFSRDPESAPMQREALDIRRAAFGAEHPLVAESWGNLAYAQWHGVDPPNWYAAEINYRRAIDMYRRVAPDDRSNLARFTFSLGVMLSAVDRIAESEVLLREALNLYRSMPVPEDRYVLECMKRYAFVLVRLGRYDEADMIIRETAAMTPDVENSPDGASWLWDQGRVFSERGELERAESVYRSVLAGACDQLARARPDLADALHGYAEALSLAATDASVDPDYLPIIAALRAHDGYGARLIAFRAIDLAILECRKGRHDRAVPILERCSEVVANQVPPGDRILARVNLVYGLCLLHTGDRARAEPLLRDAHDTLLRTFGAEHSLTVRAAQALRWLDDPGQGKSGTIPAELSLIGID